MTSYLKMATIQEKAMCVLWFFATKSVINMQRRYITQYGTDPHPDKAIRRWVKQFQETGSVLHRKGERRPSTSQEDVDRIQEVISRSPQKSTRRASLQLGLPHTTVWRVGHNRLHLHTYKVQIMKATETPTII
jgi:transposase-like protein